MSKSLNYEAEDQFNLHLDKITDESIKKRLLNIKEILVERINLERDFKKELNKLDARFEKKYKPLYEERASIINGTAKENDSESDEGGEKGIPQYWLKCLLNTSQFGDVINKNDEAILKFLEDITVDVEESGDFEVHFHFASNEYFKHNRLSKRFILDDKQNIQKCKASKIEWASEEANPTVNRVKKKLKNSNVSLCRSKTW